MAGQADDRFQDPKDLGLPWCDSPLFLSQVDRVPSPAGFADLAKQFHRDGYLAVEGWLEPELIDEIVSDSERFYDPETPFPEVPRHVSRLLKQNIGQGGGNRVQDAWWVSPAVRRLAAHPRVLELLEYLYQRAPIPFQTLNFPQGTEQEVHADSMHFDSVPAGFMCGVWVALEDVTMDDGPLVYYPGSHRLPLVRLEQLGAWAEDRDVAAGDSYNLYAEYVRTVLRGNHFPEKYLTVPKGTLLVWAANLLHGGSPIAKPENSRHSQVTHYFFEGCSYYAPILSHSLIGDLRLRSVWDIAQEKHVGHSLGEQELAAIKSSPFLGRLFLPGGSRKLWPWRPRLQAKLPKVLKGRIKLD